MIKFENVYIQYVKDFHLLFNANFEIQKNTLFVGDEFEGITAILRLISKIEKNYIGEIYIDNKNIKDIKDKELSVAYVSENPTLFKHKSIFKNLYYPLKIRKINKNDAKNIINEAISKYNLNNFEKKVSKMNLSEQIILTLIRATIRKPKYLLIENLFSKINAEYFDLLSTILKDISKDTIIIACENKEFEFYNDFETIFLEK